MGFISCHITPLIINSIRRRHTHTHIRIPMIRTGSILRSQACLPVANVPGLKRDISSAKLLSAHAFNLMALRVKFSLTSYEDFPLALLTYTFTIPYMDVYCKIYVTHIHAIRYM